MKRRPYRKILLATDGSENAKSAACSGIEIAKRTGSEVYVVYVAGISCCSPIMPESYDWEVGKKGVKPFSTSPTGSENHLSPLRFQTFNRKVF